MLELLKKYKMELTELYIKAGYSYDYFFIEIEKNFLILLRIKRLFDKMEINKFK